ncbi:MAG: hypothetical protein WCF12_03535 [Propionicimonas sp.]
METRQRGGVTPLNVTSLNVTKAIAVASLAVSLSACSWLGGDSFATQGPPVSVTSAPPSPTPTPTSASPTPSPTDTPTRTPTSTPSKPAAKGTGSMTMFSNAVSTAFVSTCKTVGGAPTLVLTDNNNDFFGTVDLTVALNSAASAVTSIAGEFGEDSEGITRKLVFAAAKPAKGTSAVLTTSGLTYKVAGTAMVYEDGAKQGSLIPYSITAKCASKDW